MTAPTDPAAVSAALQKLNYGIYVVTALKAGDELATRTHDWVSAGTVSWAMQVSMEPDRLAVALKAGSNLRETVQRSGAFALHILAESDRHLVKAFTGPADFSDDEVNGYRFERGQTGAPILAEGLAVIECEVAESFTPAGGDHVLFVGRPVRAEVRDPGARSIAIEETGFEYGG